ncbi:hypothetical protein K4K54_012068 [Colletotrichum sp. SAR 10_86]|nr:hypothetical protein KHU50_005252 [Colletotrichum sp. SAR 10_65]KAI8217055.1 hypothetical protein K4K54_012068 [Colletotrichum sp. SAR 10_86]
MFGWSQDSSNPTGDAPPYTDNIPLDPRLDSEGLQSSLESADDVANGGIGDAKEDSLLGLLNAINCSAAQQTQSSSIRVEDSRNEDMAATKRQRNTMAARKYRQKGRDRIAELEAALKNVEEERDQLRLKLVRKEAEVDALREMLDR